MMSSLFESFDLMNSVSVSMNWMVMFLPYFIMFYYWLVPSRLSILVNIGMTDLYKEFKPINKNYESNIVFFISLLLFIFLLNFVGMFPYVFTITSHMVTNLSLSLPLWLGFMLFLLKNDFNKFLCHLVPLNTPIFLMNFMVVIELVSNLIRPLTLSIRLSANLIAGHLLMILLGNFMNSVNLIFLVVALIIQNLLMILELSMSLIQAYVFSMLSMLYYSEAK